MQVIPQVQEPGTQQGVVSVEAPQVSPEHQVQQPHQEVGSHGDISVSPEGADSKEVHQSHNSVQRGTCDDGDHHRIDDESVQHVTGDVDHTRTYDDHYLGFDDDHHRSNDQHHNEIDRSDGVTQTYRQKIDDTLIVLHPSRNPEVNVISDELKLIDSLYKFTHNRLGKVSKTKIIGNKSRKKSL